MDKNMEKEYRKIFFNQKRWAKHWSCHSAHRAHYNTLDMMEPAKEVLKYFDILTKMKVTERERLKLLEEYYIKSDNGFCKNANSGMSFQIAMTEKNGVAPIYKMPKS